MSHANSQSPRTRIETKGVQYLSDGELLVTLINSGLDRRALENPWNKRWESSTDSSLFRVIEELPSEPKYKINSLEDVYRRPYPYMRENKKESFLKLCLDTKN